jgi:serine/threonine protein kinase
MAYPNLLTGHVKSSPMKRSDDSSQYPNLLGGKVKLLAKQSSEKPTADVKPHHGAGNSTAVRKICELPVPTEKGEPRHCTSSELREKVQQYYNLVGGGNAIDLEGLAKIRKALTRVLNLQDQVFGELKEQLLRFDCDGDGLLDGHETYMCIKTNLFEHGSAYGYQKQGLLDIATRTAEEAGYQMMQEIGHGNQSRAHLAHNRMKRDTCCIKTYKKSAMCKEDIDCLKDEFSALHLLAAHPNVASAADIFQDSKFYYMVQDVFTGGDFTTLRRHALNRLVDLSKSWWSELFKQSFAGLAHLHENALVHCDLKEPNIMLKTDKYHRPEVVIIDLGLVRNAACNTHYVSGTPGYIAPEVWEHGSLYPGADIFAMGVIMMQMLLDRIPPHHNPPPKCQVLPGGIFTQGTNTMAEVQRATRARTPPFHLLAEQWPDVATLAQRLLEKEVSMRPSAKQVLCDVCFRSESEKLPMAAVPSASASKQSSDAAALEGKVKLLLADLKELRSKIDDCNMSQIRSRIEDSKDPESGLEMLWSWLM